MDKSANATDAASAQLAVFTCRIDENSQVMEELIVLVTLTDTKKAGTQPCKIRV
jgi:hypothetical protein